MLGRRWLAIIGITAASAVASNLAAWAQPPAPNPATDQMPAPAGPEQLISEGTPEGEGAEPAEEEPRRDAIETDRDSFTPAVTTAGRGRLIVESAYSFLDNRGTPETHSFPELLFRYGITDRIELRFGWNYEVGGGGNVVTSLEGSQGPDTPKLERDSRVYYGFKARVNEQQNWLPESSLIVQGFTPTSGENTATQVVTTYVFGWELPRRWKLDASLRYGTASDKGDRFAIWAPSIVLKVPLTVRINVHAEYFGLFSQDQEHDTVFQFVSPGVHYLITDNFEVGARFGWGLNEQSARFFTNVGFGLRF
jgi:hypothetical protein